MILHWQCFDPESPSGLRLFPKGDRKQLFEQQMQPRSLNASSSSHYWEGQSWEPLPFPDEERMRTETTPPHTLRRIVLS